jgi:hypothetical protein
MTNREQQLTPEALKIIHDRFELLGNISDWWEDIATKLFNDDDFLKAQGLVKLASPSKEAEEGLSKEEILKQELDEDDQHLSSDLVIECMNRFGSQEYQRGLKEGMKNNFPLHFDADYYDTSYMQKQEPKQVEEVLQEVHHYLKAIGSYVNSNIVKTSLNTPPQPSEPAGKWTEIKEGCKMPIKFYDCIVCVKEHHSLTIAYWDGGIWKYPMGGRFTVLAWHHGIYNYSYPKNTYRTEQ